MTTNDDVLHSDNHSKLSAEEIAKALARHNRVHSHSPKTNPAVTSKKPAKH
jgi:hypothetical protein